jgi:hypothetical protein
VCGSTFQDSNDFDVSTRIPILSAQSCTACRTLVDINKIHSTILPSVGINITIYVQKFIQFTIEYPWQWWGMGAGIIEQHHKNYRNK